MDFIPQQEQRGWLDPVRCHCQSQTQPGLRLSRCHHLEGLLCPWARCAAPAGVGQGASVFPFLAGRATRPCARHGCGTSAGIGSLLHAIAWRSRVLPAAGALSSQNKLGLPIRGLELAPRPSPSSSADLAVLGPQGCGTCAGIGSSLRRPGRLVRALELGPHQDPCSSTASALQRSPGPRCPGAPWGLPGLAWGTCSVASPRHGDAPCPCSTTVVCCGGPMSAPAKLGSQCCGTCAGIGSLSRAGPWRNPGQPAGGVRASPRRLGRPIRALELGPHHEQHPEPFSTSASCFSRSRSPGRAEPVCGHRGVASGPRFGPSLGPRHGHRHGLCWKSRGAGGLRNATAASFLQSGVEIFLCCHSA